ncbi:MAG: riboflavin biosynthesis protein RibD [Chitinophagales bacterium]|nr:MAG: riboflavin biosynthesis protein RibD [Chitinophagales bacterium]
MPAEEKTDEKYMLRCLDLAALGAGRVAPNPMVGAVLVYAGRIIGEGYHKAFGEPHAEVHAIAAVPRELNPRIPESTLYVNLEPCNHQGKTPPCTDFILRAGIKKIVIANVDPNPVVSGKGIHRLRQAGCMVISGVLEGAGAWLNRRFFTFHKKKRPYIMLKWAQTKDGFFARKTGRQDWITGETARRLVHRWRSEESAILVGSGTVLTDNPRLTNRLWWNAAQPMRVIIDRYLRVPPSAHVFDDTGQQVLVYNLKKEDKNGHITYIRIPDGPELLHAMLNDMYRRGILSLMVEGGAVISE